jgi:hypothetical protein
MKNKKKNLQKENILYSNDDVIAIAAKNYKPSFILPKPYRGWCHKCDIGFMSLDELTKHFIQIHEGKQNG